MSNLDICQMTVIEQEQAIRARQFSPVELINSVLSRIGRVNPEVNAFCTISSEIARKKAAEAEDAITRGERLGTLHGIPVSIKDLIFTQGIRTTGGSKIYENFIPKHSDIVVERLEAAGAIVIGKTNTSEFGWVATTDNRVFGPTRNPWNLEMNAGGSSGGAAASIAMCLGSLAIGSDAGGSIRIPSSFCGVFGMKPSFGRVPRGPGFGGVDAFSHTGPITRTVRDAALTIDVISGRDDRDWFSLPDPNISYLESITDDTKEIRMGWSPNLGYAIADPKILSVIEVAIKKFAAFGFPIDEVVPSITSPEQYFSTYVGVNLAFALKDKLEEWKGKMDPKLVLFLEKQKDKSALDYLDAWKKLLAFSRGIYSIFDKYDILLTPVVAVPPFANGSYGAREIDGKKVSPLNWIALTYPFNITGQPAASVPCGFTKDGLPVGLQIVGRRFADNTVLRVAAAFEEAFPWINTYTSIE
jgi:aspartyl-tRNA(Asn)/glutamyl-tRNA(Gln) amidotransferase subunit A